MQTGTLPHALRLPLAMAGLFLLLAGCEAPREGGLPARPGAAIADTPAALAAALPAEAGGLARGATVPVQRPMQGLEVNFATANRRGAGFVQLVGPAEGAAGAAASAEFTRWLTEVSTGARPGRRLRVLEEFTEAGGANLRCAALEGSYGRQPVQSMLCVGATGRHVARLRVTMMREATPAADARGFMATMSRALPGG